MRLRSWIVVVVTIAGCVGCTSTDGSRTSVGDASTSAPAPATVLHPDSIALGAQLVTLQASDGASSDAFGGAVAVSGGTAVVGASAKTGGRGSAYVFVQAGATWTQQQILVSTNPSDEALFGCSVAIDGDTIVVGSSSAQIGSVVGQGAAYVFTRAGTTWTQQAELYDPAGRSGDETGYSVAISGDTVFVGSPNRSDGSTAAGAAYVFTRTGTSWSAPARIDAPSPNLDFGAAVAVSGALAIVGEPNGRAAYIYAQSGTTWGFQALVSTGDYGFGYAVALDGTTAIVGAYNATVGGVASQGDAYVYAQSGTSWPQQAKLTTPDAPTDAQIGGAVALQGDTAILGSVGGLFSYHSTDSPAYVFTRSGSTWTQGAKLHPLDGSITEGYGSAVAISGTNVILGASTANVGSSTKQGVAYVVGPGHTNGDACGGVTDCISGFCVDGVCCDQACGGTCQACVGAATGGSDGACANVLSGHDPRVVCGGLICSTGEQIGATCNGAGACGKTAVVPCSPFACDSTSGTCLTACATPADCATGFTCAAGGVCAVPVDAGAEVGVDAAADVADVADVADEATVDAAIDVGVDAAIDVADAPSAEEPALEAETDADAPAADAPVDAAIDVAAEVAIDAGKDASSDVADASSFDAIADAIAHETSTPTPVVSAFGACKADSDCGGARPHCVDGVCCDTPCTDRCYACTLPGSPGTCTPEPIGIDIYGACGPSLQCLGTCDGKGECIGAGPGTTCQRSHCTDASTGVGAAYCANAGSACDLGAQLVAFDCAPYACSEAIGACLAYCATSSDCAPGNICDTTKAPGVCVAAGASGGGGCAIDGAGRRDERGGLGALTTVALALAGSARARRRKLRSSRET